MGRVQFIDYKGKQVLIEDFSHLTPGKEFLDTIALAQKTITSQPRDSVLAVLDATGTRFDSEIISRMKDFVKANGPHIHCSAVVGVTGLMNIALITLSNVRGHPIQSFSDRQSALDFVVNK